MTTIYITLAVIILWLVGVDVRYYQINKKISIMHNTDKNLLELVKSAQQLNNEKDNIIINLASKEYSYLLSLVISTSGYAT